MAVTKILAKRMRLDHLIRYVCNPRKTDEQVFVSAVGCQPETAARTWMDTKRRFGRTEGVQAYHLIQSFRPGRSPRSWPTRSATDSRNGIWTGSR